MPSVHESVLPAGAGTPVTGGSGSADAARAAPRPRGQRIGAELRFWLALLLTLAGVAAWLRSGMATPPVTFLAGPLPVVIAFAATALYAGTGLAITLQRPEVRTGRILAWVAVLLACRDLGWGYLAFAATSSAPGPVDPSVVAWLTDAFAFPLVGALLITLAVIFPTDHAASGAGSRVAAAAFLGGTLVVVGTLLRPGVMVYATTYQDPPGPAGPGPHASLLQLAGYAVLIVTAGLAAALVVLRYRRSGRTTRVQLRVFAGSSLFLAVMFAFLTIASLGELGTRTARDLLAVGFLAGTALIPLAVVVAVTHSQLYAIDRLVSRSFVYGSLAAVLAGLAAAFVQLSTALFKALTGETSDAAVILTTLLLVSAVTPVRARLEKVARKLTSDEPTGDIPEVPPLFDDPVFLAALDERIRAATLTARSPRRPPPGT